ncbi:MULTISPECIES: hypothetical protein [Roseobacteraceae]|jgi:hypothetical protein|uniref:Uncharacterized protein n=1 Tax=Pseudosulfitobacter pseudonitzschiae TaxID=1402135 RepID=A0A221K1Y7_9RHOB|nr:MULTISPECIES: hypothetical protein [Roseobacteraceae]ASM73005.1 hypothetical protein SULPSESMR1_02204 [Pseudosulfitobacter pseudonitzschiae]
MTPDQIEALFTRADGSYAFARWGRPIAPIAFGVQDETLGVIKGAIEAVCTLAGHETTDMDPELGSNFMWFFFRDWDELPQVPGLDRMVPDLGPLVARLKAADANQYRAFRFDEAGGIQACFVFLRMDDALDALPADTLVLGQVAQAIVLWSDLAFVASSPLAVVGQTTVLRPDIADVIRAAYDPVMPVAARDQTHALRLAARLEVSGGT